MVLLLNLLLRLWESILNLKEETIYFTVVDEDDDYFKKSISNLHQVKVLTLTLIKQSLSELWICFLKQIFL